MRERARGEARERFAAAAARTRARPRVGVVRARGHALDERRGHVLVRHATHGQHGEQRARDAAHAAHRRLGEVREPAARAGVRGRGCGGGRAGGPGWWWGWGGRAPPEAGGTRRGPRRRAAGRWGARGAQPRGHARAPRLVSAQVRVHTITGASAATTHVPTGCASACALGAKDQPGWALPASPLPPPPAGPLRLPAPARRARGHALAQLRALAPKAGEGREEGGHAAGRGAPAAATGRGRVGAARSRRIGAAAAAAAGARPPTWGRVAAAAAAVGGGLLRPRRLPPAGGVLAARGPEAAAAVPARAEPCRVALRRPQRTPARRQGHRQPGHAPRYGGSHGCRPSHGGGGAIDARRVAGGGWQQRRSG